MRIGLHFPQKLGAFAPRQLRALIALFPSRLPLDEVAAVWAQACGETVRLPSGGIARVVGYSVLMEGVPLPAAPTVQAIRAHGVDINVWANVPQSPRMAVFDMDATLVNEETLDVLAKEWRGSEGVAGLTEQAMQGKLSFAQSLYARMALMRGYPAARARAHIHAIPYSAGAETLVQKLNQQGWATILASGGFYPFARAVQQHLQLDAIHCNRWQEDALGNLTGALIPPMLNAEAKRTVLLQECARRGLTPAEVLAVGDGANDLPMLQTAGMAVAWRPKPILCAHINLQLHHAPMDAILDFFAPM